MLPIAIYKIENAAPERMSPYAYGTSRHFAAAQQFSRLQSATDEHDLTCNMLE